jgi:2-amino-4-hydroxy-6-hydroxymethyldihydropteridine diphosphokinase
VSAAAPVRAFIGLGANLGDARAGVLAGAAALAGVGGVFGLRLSPLYRSAPVDAEGPDFVNAVAEVDTTLNAPALLRALQGIEAAHGRERRHRHAPRTLDLDLLLYGSGSIGSAGLTVPHPRLHERAFVLLPLLDLDPGLDHPRLGALAGYRAAVAGQHIERLP